LARQACSDQDWILGAPIKRRLLDLWFSDASGDTAPMTERELEAAIGAKGPGALTQALPRLLSIGLVHKHGKRYQPVPVEDLGPKLKALRRALEHLLSAIAEI
jgi:DNA-binding HxlR family transcriptional regulator